MRTESLGSLVEVCDKGRRQVPKRDRRKGPYPYCGAGGPVENVDSFTHEGSYLLLASVGSGLGPKKKSAYLMKGKFHASTNVHVLKAKAEVDPVYLMHYLNWADLTKYAQGAAMLALNATALTAIPVPLPTLEEQKKMVKDIESLSEEEASSLMDKLFRTETQ